MSPESVILLMIAGWLLVAAAMLWGMLRIARRHSHAHEPSRDKPSLIRQRSVLRRHYRPAHGH